MKALLAVLSGLFFAVALTMLPLAFFALDTELMTETSSECTTVVRPNGGGSTEDCEGEERTAGPIVAGVGGAAFLLAGALMAVASVNVRHPEERRAPAPWPGPPPARR